MFCEKCGSQIPEGSAFCPNCGNPVKPAAVPAGSETEGTPVTQPAEAQESAEASANTET